MNSSEFNFVDARLARSSNICGVCGTKYDYFHIYWRIKLSTIYRISSMFNVDALLILFHKYNHVFMRFGNELAFWSPQFQIQFTFISSRLMNNYYEKQINFGLHINLPQWEKEWKREKEQRHEEERKIWVLAHWVNTRAKLKAHTHPRSRFHWFRLRFIPNARFEGSQCIESCRVDWFTGCCCC